jgi:hypothetical protein
MKKWNPILIILLFSILSPSALAEIAAKLGRSQIGPGETVQLILQHEGQTDTQPDLTPLLKEFEIAGRSSGSNIQIINGKMSARVQLYLTLAPKHQGKLQVPALQWDGQSSPVLNLDVSSTGEDVSPGKSPSKTSSHTFVISTVGENQTYVQTAIPLKVRIYTDQPLYQASIDLHSKNELIIEQLDQDLQTSETRDGKNYQVIERTYLLSPQRSGLIQLDGPVLTAQIQSSNRNQPLPNNPMFGDIFGLNPFSGRMNATQPISIKGDSVKLNVRTRPASAKEHDWLPAQRLTLEAIWHPENGPIRAGTPVTLHLHLSAEGVSASRFPDLSQLIQLPPGLRIYPDPPRLSTRLAGNRVSGVREQRIAIIANSPGIYKIPDIHLLWWDTEKDIQREIHLPGRTLEVLPDGKGIVI